MYIFIYIPGYVCVYSLWLCFGDCKKVTVCKIYKLHRKEQNILLNLIHIPKHLVMSHHVDQVS